MTIDDQIRDEKQKYDINREAAKISAFSSKILVSMTILQEKKYYHLNKNR